MCENIIMIKNDKFDSDIGFKVGDDNEYNLEAIVADKLSNIDCKHAPNRIYTWGKSVDTSVPAECDLSFDVSQFFIEIKEYPNIRSLTGKDQIIQEIIMCHPRFLSLAESIVVKVNEMKPREIGFVCNYGKHRSVGLAYIMRKYVFKTSVIINYTLK